jgi:hypothetical protein
MSKEMLNKKRDILIQFDHELEILNDIIAEQRHRILEIRAQYNDLIIQFINLDNSHYKVILVDSCRDILVDYLCVNFCQDEIIKNIKNRVNKLVPDFKFSIADIEYISSFVTQYINFVNKELKV